MSKYNREFKMKVIIAYLNGEKGYKNIAREFGISDKSIVRKYANAYKILGVESLSVSRKVKITLLDLRI